MDNKPIPGDHASHIFYRRMAHPHPSVVRGEGIYLWDSDGKRYIDGSGGAAVVNIGHGQNMVAQAMADQAAKVAYAHSTMFTAEVLETHSSKLAGFVPVPDPKFYYMTSGSEAVETAIKFARQVQIARGQSTRQVMISRWGSYHGATLGALALTGKQSMRAPFTPLFKDQAHIHPPYCYRCPFEATYPSCDLACAQTLEEEINHLGPERVIGFIGESIGGATQGAVVPPEGYWTRIAEICQEYGLLLIIDEVMAGLGRTGRWFGINHFGLQVDIITIGKGLTGGYFPLSITAVRREDVDSVHHTQGDFNHGGTFSHHTVGAAAASAVLDFILTNDLIKRVSSLGEYLGEQLRDHLGGLLCVGDLRGLGLLWGVEFVTDPISKTPFHPGLHFSRRVADRAFERGLILYPGHGGIDGANGDHILIAPPFTIGESEIDEMVALLRGAILDVWQELR